MEEISPLSSNQASGNPSPINTSNIATQSESLLNKATTAPTTGHNQVFQDIKRQLSEEDLSSKGVQKLLLNGLERAESECEILKAYVTRYHDADKQSAILSERIRSVTTIEIMFGIGVGLGGTIMGLAPTFWGDQPKGIIALLIGATLILGASIARVVKR